MTEPATTATPAPAPAPKRKPFLVRLEPELAEDLRAVAGLDRTSQATVIRRAVRAYVKGRRPR